MTAEEHQIYVETYRAVLATLIPRAVEAGGAVKQASEEAARAVDLYQASQEPRPRRTVKEKA